MERHEYFTETGYTLNKAGGICVRNLSKKIFEERDFKIVQYVFDSSGVCISQRCIHSLGFRHMFVELEGNLFKDYKRHKIKCDCLLIEEHLSVSLPSTAKISGLKIQIRESKKKKKPRKKKNSTSTLVLRTCEKKNFFTPSSHNKKHIFCFFTNGKIFCNPDTAPVA